MITRRSLLKGTATLALSQVLLGCGGSRPNRLDLHLLKGSIPAPLLKTFESQVGQRNSLKVTPTSTLEALYESLQAMAEQGQEESSSWFRWPWAGSPTPTAADLITLGDTWLPSAIQRDLIRPLPPQTLRNGSALPAPLQSLVRRNAEGELDADGRIWGAPYRWGTMAIAYRRDEFERLGWQPTDWADLWRPELARQISLLDNARAVIGLTLKALGRSLNTTDLATVPDLPSKLAALHRQVKFYSSTAYLQPLITGDTWLAVGWSNDILAVTKRNPRIQAVVPTSGTLLWADLWVQPQTPSPGDSTQSTEASTLVQQWIEFCWQPDSVIQQSILGTAASPLLSALVDVNLPDEVLNNPLLLPASATLSRSEFLQPIPAAIAVDYRTRWITMRQTG